ncbi:ABC transporter permease [Saccharopolyspora sp. 5N708]|uniref:ABC transporter permease n=1 Tax=Saccharopolyspora sp. 5N708 TaxID=3457424 RepID=UPI003FD4EAF4
MTLLAVERIKLFSTRSPWWCTFLAMAITIGFTALYASQLDDRISLQTTQIGYQFGLMVVLVLAALSITTEYRFGTIRATFQAVPNRGTVLLAKTVVVAVVALLIGEVAAFGSWGVAQVLVPNADLALGTLDAWRQVAGVGVVFAIGAVLAVAVGTMLRQTAGAVTLLLIWSLLGENLVSLIPGIGADVQKWLPFIVANHFLSGVDGVGDMPLGPWGSLGYFAALSVGLWLIALIIVRRRDA